MSASMSCWRILPRVGAAVLVYLVVTFAAFHVIRTYDPDAPWRYLVALTPLIPAGWGVWALIRFLLSLDELEKRIQLEAIAFSFGVTVAFTFTYGFLEAAGLPRIGDVLPIGSLMLILWGVGELIARRRYR